MVGMLVGLWVGTKVVSTVVHWVDSSAPYSAVEKVAAMVALLVLSWVAGRALA